MTYKNGHECEQPASVVIDSKGVKVIVWCPGHTLHRQLDKALDLFASLGIADVKADFFGRED